MTDEVEYERRFGGVGRLVSKAALERLRGSHVCVIGVGGIGSWTVEALVRSGVGELTLVDLDEVCVSNVNRQVHAMQGTVGMAKVGVMAERARQIQPGVVVNEEVAFFTKGNAEEILSAGFDCVVDAIDSGKLKAHLVAGCRDRGIPVVVCGGAGGRKDATKVSIEDLGRAYNDPLLHHVRKELRRLYGYPKWEGKKFGARCVFSEERPVFPQSDGTVCESRKSGGETSLNCESGFGTASWVTGTMGLVAAQVVVGEVTSDK